MADSISAQVWDVAEYDNVSRITKEMIAAIENLEAKARFYDQLVDILVDAPNTTVQLHFSHEGREAPFTIRHGRYYPVVQPSLGPAIHVLHSYKFQSRENSKDYGY